MTAARVGPEADAVTPLLKLAYELPDAEQDALAARLIEQMQPTVDDRPGNTVQALPNPVPHTP